MKKIFFLLIAIFTISSNVMYAQLVVIPTTGITPLQLAQSIFGGTGITISNATYNGSDTTIIWNNIGTFTTGSTPTNLGIANGIIMATGGVTDAVGPNNSSSSTLAISPSSPDMSDPDLLTLVDSTVLSLNDASVLEFDYVSVADTFAFNYVLAQKNILNS